MTIHDVLTRQVIEVLPSREALEKLMAKRKIRLYLGVDPTGKNLHLGHTIGLRKLQQFADLGHEAFLLVGTGTVLAGDPSQRESARARITKKEIAENMRAWKAQASQVLDFSRVKIRYNGDWLLKLKAADFIEIASHLSAPQLFQRDMFQQRLHKGGTVRMHEMLYPLLQGYDSVVLDVDLEIGGTDQKFNMLVGRELQKKMSNREKYVLTTPMLTGLDGRPMSKTSGNTVNLTDSPQDMYGKLMSMKDELTLHYAELCTALRLETLKQLPPQLAKAKVAQEIAASLHGAKKAEAAAQEFENVFQKRQAPSLVPKVLIQGQMPLAEFLVQTRVAASKGEARRLLEQRGVRVNKKVSQDPFQPIRPGMRIQVGKRRFMDT